MASSAAAAAAFSHLVDRTRVPDPTLQGHAVAAFFRHLLSLPAPLPAAAHDAASALLASPHPSVAAHAAASLARLAASRADLLPPGLALPLLLAPLAASPSPRLASCLVKAVTALASCVLRSGSRFPPHDHPFVQALASGADGARAELTRQAARMVAEGLDGVVGFLRPFLMFAVVRKGDAPFAKDLIGTLAAAGAAAGKPGVAIPVLKLLEESLLHFGRGDGEEVRLWLGSAECLVDAYVVLLRKLAHAQMPTYDAQASSAKLMETLLSQCSFHQKLLGITSTVLGLSKYLFSVQKDLGLFYLPEISVVLSSLSHSLSGLEFEHEQLAGLKLLAFLMEWKYENVLERKELTQHLNEELLCVLPVINLAISPSKSVKAVASHVLSRFSLLVLDLPASHSSEHQDISMVCHISKPAFILPKLLNHLWSQPSSSGFIFMKYIASKVSPDSARNYLEASYWTHQINDYLTALRRDKLTLDGLSSKKTSSVAISSLVSSVVSVLVMHPKLGTSAAQSLAVLGASDPRLGMPLFVIILFYIKILYSNSNCSTKISLSLLESLPSLATHGFVLPLALQWISPMLKRNTSLVLYAIAVRLLCKIWIVTDWAFPNLQVILDPENFSNFISDREISTSIAASIRDVCKQNPDRGVDLILSVSFCIESRDSVVQALGLESLLYLCEADVVDFYTAWKVISKELLDYSVEPIVAHSLCALLRWGAMDAEAYSGISNNLIGILWSIGTSKKNNSEPLWVKARGTAFHSLSYYKVSLIQDAIPDFWKQNYEFFTNEYNLAVLKAMENFQDEIVKFEHLNRRRVTTDKRAAVHKFEKLLDVFPQAVFKGKTAHHQLPGAALLTLNFAPKDLLNVNEGKSKDLPRVHAAYEQAFAEMAESMYISRNIEVALLALHSWKSFVSNWMQAVVALLDIKESLKLSKASKAANDIFKILCDRVPLSTPQVAVNIALVIGALCLIVPSTAHLVISSASDFLLKWLFQYEHEHQQWSAALSLGLIFNCFHPTDKKSKFQVINGLLEVITKTKSCLVKGACGLALGYACQGLLARAHNVADSEIEATTQLNERASVEDILHTLVTSLIQLCPSSCYSLKKLSICGIGSMGGMEENNNNFDDDPWAVAGLVLGLGKSAVALYRLGAYEAVNDVKNILISWIPDVDSSSALFDERNSVSLCMGSCLALPSVVTFCQRVELLDDDLDALFNRYTSLASEVLNLNNSGTIFQNLLMAICIGAGSFLSCILDDGVHAMEFIGVKNLLDTLRHIYTHPFPPLVHLGGMFGIVNAFGAGAGDLTGMCSKPMTSQIKHEESSLVRGPVLTSPVCETLSTSMIQEILLLAKDAEDKHIQYYAAWAISFLRSRWLSKNQILYDDNGSHRSSGDLSQSSCFSEQSLVWNLSLWLSDLKLEKPGDAVPVNTIGTVLKCLSKASRLPTTDWGVIVRRCMKVEAQIPLKSTNQHDPKLLREACLYFSLAHASHISPLLQFLDDLTDILRFRRLDINVQSILLQHLSHLMKLFSDSRLEKLFEDLSEYLYSSTSSYLNYSSEQRSMIRMSFWEGIYKCLVEIVSEESGGFSFIKKCIECLLPLMTLCNDGQPEFMDEWSAAIKCLTNAQKSWLSDMLQIRNTALITEGEYVDVAIKIIIRARLCSAGCGSAPELGNIKMAILCTKTDGVWWGVLVEIAAAIYSAENSIKRQWLLDALDIGCVTAHPSTVLRFVGLLCGSCCIYMPLLVVNSTNVLSDLPVTLPSFLSSSIWDDLGNSVADRLWLLTTRIYTWAEQLAHGDDLTGNDHIHRSEAEIATFLASILRSTCIAVKDYLTVDKQLKLANLEAL
ncbi:protein RST1 isoform X2 [Phragmites australis]|uniref:protein RST1 isoform X2 n=1 Tax=Phragmites australis TaxID=29695 RepID=UPI002D784A68|nr:protein RST1 isoform X2 [Phragmites australis]